MNPWYKRVTEAAHRVWLAALTTLILSGIPTVLLAWLTLSHHPAGQPLLWLAAIDLGAYLVMRAAGSIETWAISYGLDVANTKAITRNWNEKQAQRYTRAYRRNGRGVTRR